MRDKTLKGGRLFKKSPVYRKKKGKSPVKTQSSAFSSIFGEKVLNYEKKKRKR